MRILFKIAHQAPGLDLILTWRDADGAVHEEAVTLPTAYAAAEAVALLGQIRPEGRTEAMVRRVLKTVPKAPRQGRS
ncbi:hypothetical protein [Caulobacter sp. RHG1]|uniref:hypothetical protein n=1 Tax=Caulobacter sp. (strain RHG1) TaxID=2545762 RepID=UPI0015545D6D|nr:hypothetical protein [Caulobacter sp. RHG1]NQE61966.1 hypothetical protein [Caulobacter sp. RHG1]